MTKLAFSILVLTLPFALNAQTFINNPDYVWGEGRGSTLEEADKKALESIVTALTVSVSTQSSLYLSDVNGDLNKSYKGNVSTTSSLNLVGINRYIDNNVTEGYRVYRYLNKADYSNFRKDKCKAYLQLAKDNYYASQHSGTINLTLGYYYLAYRQLDDDVLSLLDGDNDVEKARILHSIRQIINKIKVCYRPASLYDYDWSDVLNEATRPSYDSHNLHVSAYFGQPLMYLFDFEYWDGVKWSNDYVWNERGDIAEIKCTTLLPRDIRDLKYRINFQTINEEGKKINLPVPDDFYIVKVIEYVNPRRWIENDKKRGWY